MLNPDIAFLFLILGILGILFEISSPGASFPGFFGVLSLIFSVYIFSFYEINFVGVSLIGIALILYIFEVKVFSYGALTLLATLSFGFGSYYLIDKSSGVSISMSFIIIASLVLVGLAVLLIYLGLNAQKKRKSTGSEALIGAEAKVTEEINSEKNGEIIILGERWRAQSNEKISKNETVIIEKVSGLTVFVRKI
jgi:membrane-bound serine protease (ClpP class)